MPICVQCRSDVVRPCVPGAGQRLPQSAVVAPSEHDLRRLSYFRRLAIATANLKASHGLSRRRIPDWIAETIHFYDGVILTPHGRPWTISDTLIDDAFNNDGSYRWLSDFMRFATEPPKQRPQDRVIARLRLLSLAFQIAHPDVARHFCR